MNRQLTHFVSCGVSEAGVGKGEYKESHSACHEWHGMETYQTARGSVATGPLTGSAPPCHNATHRSLGQRLPPIMVTPPRICLGMTHATAVSVGTAPVRWRHTGSKVKSGHSNVQAGG